MAVPIAIKLVVLSMILRERTSTRMLACFKKSMPRIELWTCVMVGTNENWRPKPRSSVISGWSYVGISALLAAPSVTGEDLK